jgi:hypothetical protein
LIDTAFTGTSETPVLEFLSGGKRGATGLDTLTRLVTTLKDIITQQNNVIDTVRANLTEIKSQNAKFQEEVEFLQTKLDAYSVSPLSRTTSTESHKCKALATWHGPARIPRDADTVLESIIDKNAPLEEQQNVSTMKGRESSEGKDGTRRGWTSDNSMEEDGKQQPLLS